MKHPARLLIGACCLVMLATTIVLMWEYRCLREQSYKIVALKNEYKHHLTAVSRVLHDYNALRDRLETLEAASSDSEKKNDITNGNSPNNGFPEGVRVVSSDDAPSSDDDRFVVINRELEYLKQSTIDYIHKKNVAFILQRISPDEWRDYTELVHEQGRKQQQVKRGRRRARGSHLMAARKKQPGARKRGAKEGVEKPADFYCSWPIDRSSFWLSSSFGPRRERNGTQGFHYGIDLAACKGTPVWSAAPGVIIEVRREHESGGYGNTVVIAHNKKYRTRYAHMKAIKVRAGQHVDRGMLIGTVGNTGNVRSSRGGDGTHLHFEVYAFGKKVDPLYFLT